MRWTYRVLRRIENEEENLYIVEVFYDPNDDSILGWSEREIIWGEGVDGLEGLRRSLARMLNATERPVLDEAELLQRAEEVALSATRQRSQEG